MAPRGGKKRAGSAADMAAWDDESGNLRVLIDTPRGSAVKYKLDVEKGVYKVSHMLAAGLAFPFDFGSIPGTLAADGDPLDLLVLAEAGTFPGCLLEVRLVGALVARQTQKGRTTRNDRLIGVAAESRTYSRIRAMRQVPKRLIDDVERFFVAYNEARGRRFRVDKRVGAAGARRLVSEGERLFARRAKK